MAKTEMIAVRCTPEEKELIKKHASADYMPAAAYALKIIMTHIREQENKQ